MNSFEGFLRREQQFTLDRRIKPSSKKTWFVLKGSILNYYKSSSKMECVSLSPFCVIEKKSKDSFYINAPHFTRIMYLWAEEEWETDEWVTKLKENVSLLKSNFLKDQISYDIDVLTPKESITLPKRRERSQSLQPIISTPKENEIITIQSNAVLSSKMKKKDHRREAIDYFEKDSEQPSGCFLINPLCELELHENMNMILSCRNTLLNLFCENRDDFVLWSKTIKERIIQSSDIYVKVKGEEIRNAKDKNTNVLFSATFLDELNNSFWYVVTSDHLFQFKNDNSSQPLGGIILNGNCSVKKNNEWISFSVGDKQIQMGNTDQLIVDEFVAILENIISKNSVKMDLPQQRSGNRFRSSSIEPSHDSGEPIDVVEEVAEDLTPLPGEDFVPIKQILEANNNDELDILFTTYLNYIDTFTLFEFLKPYPVIVKKFLTQYFPTREWSEFSKIYLDYLISIKDEDLKNEMIRLSIVKAPKKEEIHHVLPTDEFWKYSDIEIAQQLTLLAYHKSLEVTRQDLTFSSRAMSENIEISSIKKTNDFNAKIALWVANTIILVANPLKRAESLTRFIKIMVHLREMSNFDTMWAVKEGILCAALKRMKKTRDIVERKLYDEVNLVESLSLSPAFFLKQYQKAKSPKLPPIHVILITIKKLSNQIPYFKQFCTDGNIPWNFANRLYSKTSILNSEGYKIKQNSRLLSCLRGYLSLKFSDFHELFVWSLLYEPKLDQKDKDVQNHIQYLKLSREFDQEDWMLYYL